MSLVWDRDAIEIPVLVPRLHVHRGRYTLSVEPFAKWHKPGRWVMDYDILRRVHVGPLAFTRGSRRFSSAGR